MEQPRRFAPLLAVCLAAAVSAAGCVTGCGQPLPEPGYYVHAETGEPWLVADAGPADELAESLRLEREAAARLGAEVDELEVLASGDGHALALTYTGDGGGVRVVPASALDGFERVTEEAWRAAVLEYVGRRF